MALLNSKYHPHDTGRRLRLALAIILFSPAILFAVELPPASDSVAASDSAPAAPLAPDNNPEDESVNAIIDTPRDYVSEQFVSFASKIDEFFGSDRNYQESNKSVLQFDLTRVIDKTAGNKIVPSFRAKLHLPQLQNRLRMWQKNIHLLLESNPDQNQPGGATGETTSAGKASLFKEVATPDSYGAALRIENSDDSPWRLSADTGLKLVGAEDPLKLNKVSLDPFVRTRGSYKIQRGPVQFQVAESVFWFNTIGLGENTQLDIDYRFSEPLLFRATSGATWMRSNINFTLHQDFSLYQTLDEHHSLLYQLSANGVSRPQPEVSEYVALLLYRQRLNRDWMFLELSPQLHYPKVNNYALNAQFVVRLEILFSK